MVTTLSGEAGQSVTSRAVVVIGRGHVPVPVQCPSLVGSTARTWDPLCSLMCATQDLVHVSILKWLRVTVAKHYINYKRVENCSFSLTKVQRFNMKMVVKIKGFDIFCACSVISCVK